MEKTRDGWEVLVKFGLNDYVNPDISSIDEIMNKELTFFNQGDDLEDEDLGITFDDSDVLDECEISIVRSSNEFGHAYTGGDGRDKFIINQEGLSDRDDLIFFLTSAHVMCNALNKEGI